jgi:hypothetical protein
VKDRNKTTWTMLATLTGVLFVTATQAQEIKERSDTREGKQWVFEISECSFPSTQINGPGQTNVISEFTYLSCVETVKSTWQANVEPAKKGQWVRNESEVPNSRKETSTYRIATRKNGASEPFILDDRSPPGDASQRQRVYNTCRNLQKALAIGGVEFGQTPCKGNAR